MPLVQHAARANFGHSQAYDFDAKCYLTMSDFWTICLRAAPERAQGEAEYSERCHEIRQSGCICVFTSEQADVFLFFACKIVQLWCSFSREA